MSTMTIEDVLIFFEEKSVPARIKHLVNDGLTQSCFGVMMSDLRGLGKKIKQDHALGLILWKSKYYEAMLLACLILDGSRFSQEELQTMVDEISHDTLIDFFVRYVVMSSKEYDILSKYWMNRSCVLVGRAGWMIEVEKIINNVQPASHWDGLLEDIKAGMKYAQTKKQEAMNRTLVEMAVHNPHYKQIVIDIAEKIGPLDDKPVRKGCTSSYAPIWIEAVLNQKK